MCGNTKDNLQEKLIETKDETEIQEENGDKKPRKESHLRSLLKGISYRVIETFVTFGISYFVTGDVTSALQIGVIEFFVQIAVYYFHERFCVCIPV